jgi:hypothetical protein
VPRWRAKPNDNLEWFSKSRMNSHQKSGGYPFPPGSDVLGPVSGRRFFRGQISSYMSALEPLTDSSRTSRHVRFVPIGDIASDERERKGPPTKAAYFGFSAFMCRT